MHSQSARWLLMIGLRHEIGGDWGSYIRHMDTVTNMALQEALNQGDPGYSLLNWLAPEIGFGVYFTNAVCAVLFVWLVFATHAYAWLLYNNLVWS